MTLRRRRPALRTAALAVVVAGILVAGCGDDGPEPTPPLEGGTSGSRAETPATLLAPDTDDTTADDSEALELARAAAHHFLDTYVDPDGRVVRHNQGGDTVSEGQAYAMLIAVAIDDEATFDRVWTWTRDNLMRDDGLLAWLWKDGAIVDHEFATDADLDAAHALLLAAEAFDNALYQADGLALADAILTHATLGIPGGRLLMPGSWAFDEHTINPSYFAPLAYSILFRYGDDARWGTVAATSREATDHLTREWPHLPPDWANVSNLDSPSPSGEPPVFGFDAGRVFWRFALDCDPAGRDLAARAWPFFDGVTNGATTAPAETYHLDGAPQSDRTHPTTIVAAAASAHAAGDHDSARRLLDLATLRDQEEPSYYGAALVALGRLGLDTDRLGECPSD